MLLKLRARLPGAAGRQAVAARVSRRAARPGHGAVLGAAPADARRLTPTRCWSEPMPLYEYQCDVCGHRFEVIQKFSDPPIDVCPKCGGPVQKLLSSPAIQFKGSGFYITDYARRAARPTAAAARAARTTRPTRARSPRARRPEIQDLDIERGRVVAVRRVEAGRAGDSSDHEVRLATAHRNPQIKRALAGTPLERPALALACPSHRHCTRIAAPRQAHPRFARVHTMRMLIPTHF